MYSKEIANLQRQKLAEECVSLSKTNEHLVIELPTGTGKGRIVAECIRRSTSTKKWLVVVPEIVQIKNYKADLKKHGNDDLLQTKIEEIICYASLKNYVGRELNLHLNECHRMSDFRTDAAITMDFDQVISDSATISPEIKERLHSVAPFVLYRKTLKEVIELGILPEPLIICRPVELDNSDRVYPASYGKKKTMLTAQAYYNYLEQNVSFWEDKYKDPEDGRLSFQKNLWMKNASKRKRFMAECKTEAAKTFIQSLRGKRYVCFCGSVDQAIELGGDRAIHSNNTGKENLEIINDFNYGISSRLYACMMGVEGMNFEDVDVGLIVQLDNTERLPIQKTGRVFRSDIPELHVFYIPGTQDEKYLKKFLKNFDPKYIQGYEQEKTADNTQEEQQEIFGIRGKRRDS